jgi:hypothetical protein
MGESKLSRREALELSGAALGGVALAAGTVSAAWDPLNPPPNPPGVTSVPRRR